MSLQAITNGLKKLIREMRDKNVPLPFLLYNERRAVPFFSRRYKSAGGAHEQNLSKTKTIT